MTCRAALLAVVAASCSFDTQATCALPDVAYEMRLYTVSNNCPDTVDDKPRLTWLARPPVECSQEMTFSDICDLTIRRTCGIERSLWLLHPVALGGYAGQLQLSGSCFATFDVELRQP